MPNIPVAFSKDDFLKDTWAKAKTKLATKTYLLIMKIENVDDSLTRFEKPENLYCPRKMYNIETISQNNIVAFMMTINNVLGK